MDATVAAGMLGLTPKERDRLLLFQAAELARARRARGLRLNVPEAAAVIADVVCEAARDGLDHAGAAARGREVLGPDDVLPGVADLLRTVAVEPLFPDGSRLVLVIDPIGGPSLGPEAPGAVTAAPVREAPAQGVVRVEVVNEAPVPIAVTSHYHFFEANPRLRFDRAAAYGRRLDVPAGACVRLAPGERREVALVPIGGARVVIGAAGLVDGPLDAPGQREAALERARACGYRGAE
jgi:urease subunit gamma/beta